MPQVQTDLKDVAVDDVLTAMDGTDRPSEEEKTSGEETTEETTKETEDSSENEESEETSEEESSEDDVEALKAKLAKSEKDKENYRRGMLAAQVKTRELPIEAEQKITESDDEVERKVTMILAKREQRIAMTQLLDPDHPQYIPELSDKEQSREIFEYLPQHYDRTSAEAVKRAVRAATVAWRFDRGIPEPKKKKEQITDTGMGGGDAPINPKKPEPVLNMPKSVPMREWFK